MGIADLLTAGPAAEHGVTVQHYDSDVGIAAELLDFEHRVPREPQQAVNVEKAGLSEQFRDWRVDARRQRATTQPAISAMARIASGSGPTSKVVTSDRCQA